MQPPKPSRPQAAPQAAAQRPAAPRSAPRSPAASSQPAPGQPAPGQPALGGRRALQIPDVQGTAFLGSDPAPVPAADGPEPLVSRKLENRVMALGLATELLHTRPPFSNFKFGKLTGVVRGQIKRGHYLFTFRGRQPVGYIGWAECDRKIAQAWMERSYTPTYQECNGGDSCVLITFVSPGPAVTLHLIREARKLYPDRPIYFMREYGDGKKRKATVLNRFFDQAETGESRSS
jgi:hemolysin-activating ACP:hemolysin acyltransferase